MYTTLIGDEKIEVTTNGAGAIRLSYMQEEVVHMGCFQQLLLKLYEYFFATRSAVFNAY